MSSGRSLLKLCRAFPRRPPGVAVERPQPPLRRGAGAAGWESRAHLLNVSARRINQAAALQCFARGVRDQGRERDRAFSGDWSPAASALLPQAQSEQCSITGSGGQPRALAQGRAGFHNSCTRRGGGGVTACVVLLGGGGRACRPPLASGLPARPQRRPPPQALPRARGRPRLTGDSRHLRGTWPSLSRSPHVPGKQGRRQDFIRWHAGVGAGSTCFL